MEIFYWRSDYGNFGDDLNDWLWDFLLPGIREIENDQLLVGVGTLLNTELLPAERRKLVIGSGVGYGATPSVADPRLWDVRCVRGPLSARALGLDDDLGIIDPAVMVADMPEFAGLEPTGSAIFIPHWETAAYGPWEIPRACAIAGLSYVSPCDEAKSVIRAIAQAGLVVAESMHAAILADAFRVPWIAVAGSRRINAFKWTDWGETVGITYDPVRLPLGGRYRGLRAVARRFGVNLDRLKGTAQSSPAPAASGGAARSPRLQSLARQSLAVPVGLALRRARSRDPQLSPPGRLEERKDRLRAVLAQVRVELGLA